MFVYRISDALFKVNEKDGLIGYSGTLARSHQTAKTQFYAADKARARIELFDVPTDKETIVDIANWGIGSVVARLEPLRTWGLSPRGGLMSLENGQ